VERYVYKKKWNYDTMWSEAAKFKSAGVFIVSLLYGPFLLAILLLSNSGYLSEAARFEIIVVILVCSAFSVIFTALVYFRSWNRLGKVFEKSNASFRAAVVVLFTCEILITLPLDSGILPTLFLTDVWVALILILFSFFVVPVLILSLFPTPFFSAHRHLCEGIKKMLVWVGVASSPSPKGGIMGSLRPISEGFESLSRHLSVYRISFDFRETMDRLHLFFFKRINSKQGLTRIIEKLHDLIKDVDKRNYGKFWDEIEKLNQTLAISLGVKGKSGELLFESAVSRGERLVNFLKHNAADLIASITSVADVIIALLPWLHP
jgi:hypothetical protein